MINPANDSVYLYFVNRYGSTPDKYLYRDPYFRYLRILDKLEKKNILAKKQKCLDLGCMRPELASLLINNYDAKVTGMDQWDMMGVWPDINMKFFNTNIEEDFTQYIDDPFDIIFALEILEHMIDTDVFLERLRKSIKKDGTLVISTPNINSLRNRVTVPMGKYPQGLEYKNIVHHVRLYNVHVLKKHLAEYGFEVIDMFGVIFLPLSGPMQIPFYRNIGKMLGNNLPSLCANIVAIAKPI